MTPTPFGLDLPASDAIGQWVLRILGVVGAAALGGLVVGLVTQGLSRLLTTKPVPRVPLNRCGYLVHDVLLSRDLDLARLLVGSEGTLALFTEATLRTIPLPGGRAVVLLTDLDATVKLGDGGTGRQHGSAGDVLWSGPVTHAATNLGSRQFEMVVVEVK